MRIKKCRELLQTSVPRGQAQLPQDGPFVSAEHYVRPCKTSAREVLSYNQSLSISVFPASFQKPATLLSRICCPALQQTVFLLRQVSVCVNSVTQKHAPLEVHSQK